MSQKDEFYKAVYSGSKTIYSHALRLTKDEHDAEDLIGETVLRALKSKSAYTDFNNVSGWLYTIMKNIHFDNCRKAKNKVDARGLVYTCDIFDLSTKHELQRALKSIPKKYAEFFELYFIGYKYEEISEMKKIKLNTVKSRIRVARIMLRAYLN